MFSRRNAARLATFATFAAIVGGGLFVFVSRASTNADPAPAAVRSDVPGNPIFTPWSEYLSNQAVDSLGIENDLDGNASALIP